MVRVDMEGKWTGILLRAKCALPRKDVPHPDQLSRWPSKARPRRGP